MRFNDRHVIDSDSELMQSLNDSGTDLVEDIRKANNVRENDRGSLRRALAQKISKRRRTKKCAMLKRLDVKIEEHVGKYRHRVVDVDDYDEDRRLESAPSEVSSAHRSDAPSNASGIPGSLHQNETPGNDLFDPMPNISR